MITVHASAQSRKPIGSDAANGPRDGAAVSFVGDGAIPREPTAAKVIEQIRTMRGIRRITALPDTCMGNLEAPMSMVTEMHDWLVPSVATNVMNCGVGVIDTGLQASDVSAADLERLLHRIWDATLSPDYEISGAELERFFLEGVDALRGMGLFGEAEQSAFEFGGNVLSSQQAAAIDLDDTVPWLLRQLRGTRTPGRLRLQGNHFLEVHAVEDVMDRARLETFGLSAGRLVLMLHMDHRLTGGLNLHFVTRKKLREARLRKRTAYELSKLQFHFKDPRKWPQFRERLRLYFLERGYVSLRMDSPEGRRYLDAHAVGTNYGYAGRGVIYRVCLDVLRSEFGMGPTARILWDTNHESIRVRESGEAQAAVVRKGAVQCFRSKPAFLLGHYDVHSLLGECAGSAETAFSYDHGSKHVRRVLGGGDGGDPELPPVARFVMPEGSSRFQDAHRESHRLRSRAPLDVLARTLRDKGALHPVSWLRPVANLSQE